MFCKVRRPVICSKNINLCCLLCDEVHQCKIKNSVNGKIQPCERDDSDDDRDELLCDQMI